MSDLATQGTPVITSPPLFYPSTWTKALIDNYITQFQERAQAGIPNYAPWWITNPEWADNGTTFTPTNDPARPAGTISPGHLNPATGQWIDTSQTPQPTTTTNNNMLILLILLSMRNN